MAITLDKIKELRELTHVGMQDCKNALVSANGDMEAALKILQEKGLADTKKRADRENNEGGVFSAISSKRAALGLVGCETDFVANNENFVNACNNLMVRIVESDKNQISDFDSELTNIGQITKENVALKQLEIFELADNEVPSTYIHTNNKRGSLAIIQVGDLSKVSTEAFKEFAKNIALQVTASAPFYLTTDEVPESEIQNQKEIFEKQMEGDKKKPEILEKIFAGKIAKYKSEVSLLTQEYIKDEKLQYKITLNK